MGNGMNKILPGLYLGNFRDSKDPVQLSSNNITHIISVHESSKPVLVDKKYLCLVASDVSTQNLSQYFSAANDFIQEARSSGGNVLVHCLAGVSRSTTIVISYLMTITNLSWKECLGAVQQNRPCANPNFGFQRQLLEYQYNSAYEERKRLLEKFPHTKELMEQDRELVQEFSRIHKSILEEREKLRSEVARLTSHYKQADSTCSGDNDCSYFSNDDCRSVVKNFDGHVNKNDDNDEGSHDVINNNDVSIDNNTSTDDIIITTTIATTTNTTATVDQNGSTASSNANECKSYASKSDVSSGVNTNVISNGFHEDDPPSTPQQSTTCSQKTVTTSQQHATIDISSSSSSSMSSSTSLSLSSSSFLNCKLSCNDIKQNLDYLLDLKSTPDVTVDVDKL